MSDTSTIYTRPEQMSQVSALARVLLQTISHLEDNLADMESEQMRMLVDIRLSAEILCERLAAVAEAA